MAIEIERKYLVKNDSFIKESNAVLEIKQGFLNSNKNRVVRIRVANEKGYITIKGVTSSVGTTRYEWEKEISKKEALELLGLCEETIIEKKRYLVQKENHTFEIDVFEGKNIGLTIAEIELNFENETFVKPEWLGKEVTGNSKYYNSELSRNPFVNW